MKSITASLFLILLIIQAPSFARCAPPEVANTVHRLHNTATPHDGHQVLHPTELWRSGGDSDDFLFGFIITAEIDEEGNVYLLDRWLGAIHVLGPDGKFVRQLSRQGEGPGETNQPTHLTWLPDGELGITQPLPGRLVRIDGEGNPVGDVVPDRVSAKAGQFGIITSASWRGGTLAYCGSQTNFRKGRLEVTSFLAVCDLNTGAELVSILDKQSLDDGRTAFREADQYWIQEGRWCLGPDGKIYTAPQRDTYAIHVYRSNGALERIIERDYEPWHRTMDEKTALQKRFTRPDNEWGGGREVGISNDEPCITDLRVANNGELWVRHSRSSRDQTPGVFATWDVFAATGTYLRAVSIKVNGDPESDCLLFLNDDRLLLIRGFKEASNSMWGAQENGEQEIVGEIIFYNVEP